MAIPMELASPTPDDTRPEDRQKLPVDTTDLALAVSRHVWWDSKTNSPSPAQRSVRAGARKRFISRTGLLRDSIGSWSKTMNRYDNEASLR